MNITKEQKIKIIKIFQEYIVDKTYFNNGINSFWNNEILDLISIALYKKCIYFTRTKRNITEAQENFCCDIASHLLENNCIETIGKKFKITDKILKYKI